MFDLYFFLVPVALALFVLGGAIVGILAFQRTSDIRAELKALERRLDLLANELREAGTTPAAEPGPEPEAEPVEAASPRVEPEAEPAPAAAPAPAPPPTGAGRGFNWEEAFTARWLVWLGAVTLALGGIFLVKYTIDQGLLGPTVRIILGVLMGLGLIAVGEWLRRRPLERAWAAISPSYVPPALTSAGAVTLFGSIYAAYALYDMLAPLIAFVLLAGIAALAVLLSFLHGPFMALLGIVGGFFVPLLVQTGEHVAEALFPYLALLIAGALAVVRYMGWWWLAWVTLAGAAIWPLVWYLFAWEAGDVYILGAYLLLSGALFVLVRHVWGPQPPDLPGVPWPWMLPPAERVAWTALAVVAILIFILVRMDGYGVASLAVMAGAIGLSLLHARREPAFDGIPIVMLAVTALAVALWHLPRIVSERAPMYILDGQEIGKVSGPVIPPELNVFFVTSAIFAALFALGGFVALWGARRPALWAALSAAAPLVLFALGYWRIKNFELDLAWTVVALALSAVLVVAAERVGRYRQAPGMTGALGAYAVGVVAALALAATTALENAWLTVALAAQLPAIAWIEARLELPALRRTALVLATIVLVRLALNPELLSYRFDSWLGLHWLIYGYGLPALAFYAAAYLFRRRGDDVTVTVLEAGGLVFFVLLVTLEIRNLVTGGPLDAWRYPFEERALDSIAWLAIAYGLYRRHGMTGRAVPVWGWRILAGMATVQVALLQVLIGNPLFSNDVVGPWPVLNLMALAYGGPLVFAILFLRHARTLQHLWVMRIAGAMALATSFVWLSLEVRHAFQGERLAYGSPSDAEWYAYSLAWLVYAGVLLAVGIWRGYSVLRHASLGVFMLTVLKVFLYDMAGLTGIYRALSFIGLGLALVAVGYFYRRFVFPPQPPQPAAASAPSPASD